MIVGRKKKAASLLMFPLSTVKYPSVLLLELGDKQVFPVPQSKKDIFCTVGRTLMLSKGFLPELWGHMTAAPAHFWHFKNAIKCLQEATQRFSDGAEKNFENLCRI